MSGEIITLVGQYIIAGIIIAIFGLLAFAAINTNQDDPSPKWNDIKDKVLASKPKYRIDIFSFGKKKN